MMRKNKIKADVHSMHLLFMFSVLIGGGLCYSCSDDDSPIEKREVRPPAEEVQTIEVSMPTFEFEGTASAQSTLLWTKGDAYRLYATKAQGGACKLVQGAGTDMASFVAPDSKGMEYAVYPAECMNSGLDKGYSNLLFPMYGQNQYGNASTDSLRTHNYMLADLASDNLASLNFSHLVAQVDFSLTLPVDFKGQVTKMELLLPPGEDVFVGDYCPADTTMNKMTHRQALALHQVLLGTDCILKASMMIAPCDLVNQNLTIAVTTDDAVLDFYYTEVDNFSKSFEAGHLYKMEYQLEAVGEKYPTSDYTLSEDGKTLVQWNEFGNNDRVIDMNKDIHLRRVETLGELSIAVPTDVETEYESTSMKSLQLPDALQSIEWTTFAYFDIPDCKTQVGVGPNVNHIDKIPAQISYLSWHVSKDNQYYAGVDDHLMDKKEEALLNVSCPLQSNSTLTVKEGVRRIAYYSFTQGLNIDKVILPLSLTHLGYNAFPWCEEIKEIVVQSIDPNAVAFASTSFNDSLHYNAKLVVPVGSEKSYANHERWGRFKNIEAQKETRVQAHITWDYRKDKLITRDGNIYTVDCAGYQMPVSLDKEVQWTASCSDTWVTLSSERGKSDMGPTLIVQKNNTNEWRYCKISLTINNGEKQILYIQQQPETYIVPVVVHILRDGQTDAEGITNNMIYELLERVNKRYMKMPYYDLQGHVISYMDTHIRVVLATQDPDGNNTTGIVSHMVPKAIRKSDDFMRFEKPMTEQDIEDHKLVWRQDKYVNIFIYQFDKNDKIIGCAHYPYIRQGVNNQFLWYFYELSTDRTYNNIPSMHSISIDASLFKDENEKPAVEVKTVNTTLHELGHYFGLHHTFDDGPGPGSDDAVDDTPNYDRNKYGAFLERAKLERAAYNNHKSKIWPNSGAYKKGWAQVYWRLPKGSFSEYDLLTHAADAFKASNIMDYYYMEMDEQGFTPGQIERMRFALAHSPTLPHDGVFTRGDEETTFEPEFTIPVRMDE